MPCRRRTLKAAPILLGAVVALTFWTARASAQVPALPLPTPTPLPSAIEIPDEADLPVHVATPETGDPLEGDPVAGEAGKVVPQSSYKEWTRADADQAPEGTEAGGASAPESSATGVGPEPETRDATAPRERRADPYGTGVAGSVVDTFKRAVALAEPAALPLSLSVIALLLLGIAARGPGRLAKVEDDAEAGGGGVFRL